jgi:hypothetical protein
VMLVYKSRRPCSTIRHHHREYHNRRDIKLSDERVRRMFCLSRTKFYALSDQIRLMLDQVIVEKGKQRFSWDTT